MTLPLIRSVHFALQRSVPAPAYRALRASWRAIRPWLPARALSRPVAGIPGRVHVEDHMLREFTPDAAAHYSRVGREPVQRMEQALAATGRDWSTVRRFLDYGAGHARVLRWIRRGYPAVEVTAADVNRQAIRFCAAEFGALPLKVPMSVDQLRLTGPWDLIWVGSVLTHLSAPDGVTLLQRLRDVMSADGVMLFTTHSELITARLPEYGPRVRAAARNIETELDLGRVFFLPPDAVSGAVTFHSRAATHDQISGAGLHLLRHWPRGWDDHQDVWAVTRVPDAAA